MLSHHDTTLQWIVNQKPGELVLISSQTRIIKSVHVYGIHYFDSWNQTIQHKPHIFNAKCISADRAEQISRETKVYLI